MLIEQTQLQKKLECYLQLPCFLKINENRSTMIRLLEKKRERVTLSIHKMFLRAPEEIIEAVAHYVRGTRKNKRIYNQQIRFYIHENLSNYDFSHLVDQTSMTTKGKHYDLKKIYEDLNREYFQGTLHLHLTWYGDRKLKNSSRLTFGQYLMTLKLIKIHRLLDDVFFPEFFVSFIVYHEMLHAYVPAYIDSKGRFRIHSPEFKALEKQFKYYKDAIRWEKANKEKLFITPRIKK